MPERNRAVIVLSSMHHNTYAVDGGEEKKPPIVLDYNATKDGVETPQIN